MGIKFHPKRLFRFSIGMILFAMLCLGGYLSGYRVGFDRGYDRSQVYVVIYPVGDLITSRNPVAASSADFDSLIALIVTTIAPQDWMENGSGDGEIQPFAANRSLVISQTQRNHQAVAALLERMRKSQTPIAATNPPMSASGKKDHATP